MDLESMFSPSSYASETKETTVTVHQADVALRMGQSRVFMHAYVQLIEFNREHKAFSPFQRDDLG